MYIKKNKYSKDIYLNNKLLYTISMHEKKLGKLDKIQKYNNGSIGAFYENGNHRFIKGPDKLNNIKDDNRNSYINLKTAVTILKNYINSNKN